FLEVETPILQRLYGGALARPFVTHYNALDKDFYLRIADELYLKRLIVGGLERVYEIGKDFRNEGFSRKHQPEFTMLEWYQAYADYNDIADELEELVESLSHLATDKSIDWSRPWKRITLRDAILQEAEVDIHAARDKESLLEAARAKGVEPPPDENWPKLVDWLLS